jgi:hypothetical protein
MKNVKMMDLENDMFSNVQIECFDLINVLQLLIDEEWVTVDDNITEKCMKKWNKNYEKTGVISVFVEDSTFIIVLLN